MNKSFILYDEFDYLNLLSNKNKFTISKSDANDIENLNEMLNLEKIKSYNA